MIEGDGESVGVGLPLGSTPGVGDHHGSGDALIVGTAVAEGRRIYANIRTFLRYGLSGGLAEEIGRAHV